jgi:hypothetical protein
MKIEIEVTAAEYLALTSALVQARYAAQSMAVGSAQANQMQVWSDKATALTDLSNKISNGRV